MWEITEARTAIGLVLLHGFQALASSRSEGSHRCGDSFLPHRTLETFHYIRSTRESQNCKDKHSSYNNSLVRLHIQKISRQNHPEKITGLSDGPAVKNTSGSGFSSQHPPGGSQLSVTAVLGDPRSSSDLLKYQVHLCTVTHAGKTLLHMGENKT